MERNLKTTMLVPKIVPLWYFSSRDIPRKNVPFNTTSQNHGVTKVKKITLVSLTASYDITFLQTN